MTECSTEDPRHLMFEVTWSMAIYASSPEDAARQALDIHRDPASIATVFRVDSGDGSWVIDVEDPDDPIHV